MRKNKDLQIAINVAYEAGVILKKNFGKLAAIKTKTDSAADVVTKLDIEIEELIATRLTKHDPTIGFKGEEFGMRRESERFWLVDPIDGTGFFIRGIPYCSTMIALIEKGEVIASVIYDFINDELYAAEKNKGSTMNGKPIHVSNRALKDSYITVESRLDTQDDVKKFLELSKKCVAFDSAVAGYEFILVASGRLDGRINFNGYGRDYDFAPGSLLVSEAGGIVKNIGKKTYDYTNLNFLAVNPIIYKELTTAKDALFPIFGY